MKAIAWFEIEKWCLDLAYVDNIAIDNNGVKFLPVLRDLFDTTVDVKGLKTKDSKGKVHSKGKKSSFIFNYDSRKESNLQDFGC